MKSVSAIALGILCASFTLNASAQEYMFTYSKLYSSVKNNAKPEYKDVKVGVFFLNADTKRLCEIEKAWMEKEKHYEELKTSASHELMLPVDSNLKEANPLVFVDTPQDTRCDFSLVVMSKQPLEGRVSYDEVEPLLPQMQNLLESLGGMFSSWFTPDVEGVTLEFSNDLNDIIKLSSGEEVAISNGRAQVTLEQITKDGWMELPQATTRVLPFLPGAKK